MGAYDQKTFTDDQDIQKQLEMMGVTDVQEQGQTNVYQINFRDLNKDHNTQNVKLSGDMTLSDLLSLNAA